MKTISILTGILSLFLFSCGEKGEIETPNEDTLAAAGSSREVTADTAENLMGAYQVWRSMSPEFVTWNPDDSTLTFTTKKLTRQQAELITKVNDVANIYADLDSNAKIGNKTRMPYTFSDMQAQSFYIDKADIDSIESKINGNNSGYRAYLAMEYDPSSSSHGLTHLYLGPANKDADGIFTDPEITNSSGQRIFLDLILPCPNGCPSTTPAFGSNISDFHPNQYYSGSR